MSMRTRLIGLSVLAGLFLLVPAAAGMQAPPESKGPSEAGIAEGGGGMGGIGLLRQERVQEELKLTEAQKAKLEELLGTIRQELRERARALKSVPPEQRRQKWEEIEQELRKQAPQLAERLSREIAALLEPEQLKRFRQIELRDEGPWVLLRADVVEALALTDAQKEQLRQISRETEDKMRSAFRETAANEEINSQQRQQVFGKLNQERLEGQKRAASVLTPDQRKQLLELMGTAPDASRDTFSPRRPAFRQKEATPAKQGADAAEPNR